MLQRFALLLLLLVLMGASAMFAANHFGVTLPWDIAVRRAAHPTPDVASNNREPEASRTAQSHEDRAESKGDVLASTAEALGGKISPPPPGSVALDISRISPEGMSVFAGRAEPETYVTVMENGKPAGSARADSNGEWSIATEHRFASTDPKLSFQTSATPPPEETPPAKTAEAKPAAPQSEAATVAGDVMKKFENLVSEAREEARKEKEKVEAPQPAPGAETKTADASAPTPTAEPPRPAVTVETSPAETAPTTAPPANTTPAEDNALQKGTTAAVTAAAGPNARESVIPVPIMFVYNEATLTPEGHRAASLLLEYLTLKRLTSIELTGHADERGTDEYNFDLSRDRLETVARLLKDGGYTGELKLVPKGKSEPYTGIDRTKFHGEALYQFDRRVELHLR